ncbi:hypothetical protein J7T55_011008 [Diaporthe amygdali]|uniref:uncharacterized protein n=1 Tax=Phomopsis amygdali TaxID=1214568 RepID=UPI0022FE7D92|nr:uncharacterized protein J7T55_011008 [Diaporthe amygdali]KAJ0103738.1 hypothetical protein J7T55_011008 [Diaporthe amygdali]
MASRMLMRMTSRVKPSMPCVTADLAADDFWHIVLAGLPHVTDGLLHVAKRWPPHPDQDELANNGLKKRIFDHASLASPTEDDPPAERCASDKHNDFDYIQDAADHSRMCDPANCENSLCKSNGRLEKKGSVPGSRAVIEGGPKTELDGISRLTYGSKEHRDEDETKLAVKLEKMRGAVKTLLECVGEDVDREGLLDTPSRYAKALLFMTKGYQDDVQDAANNALFPEGHDGIVIVKDIDISSLCEHHLMHIGYVPSGTVIGLSKLPRIAEIFCRRLQIQERLTKEVATAIMDILAPRGVAVVMECRHMCMVMRGVEKTGAKTLTSCLIGCFEQDSERRNQFFNLVGTVQNAVVIIRLLR